MVKRKVKKFFISPFEKFVQIESFAGFLLFGTTILALAWANSPWEEHYQQLWGYEMGFEVGNFQLSKPLILWINDGLMSIFFFLIGLEVKREVLLGELNTLKKAFLPIIAALGGVIVPLALFLTLNKDGETLRGWGIPMATDIAFSLAILKVVGKRIPLALTIFLTALAIADDIGAVLAIALFYSSNIDWILIGYSAIPFTVLSLLALNSTYNKYLFLLLGLGIWFLFLKSGIHPTIAGILVAFTIPISQKIGLKTNIGQLNEITSELVNAPYKNTPVLSKEQMSLLDDLEEWTTKVQSPLQKLEHALHGWVAYLIIPLFALANAGIVFKSAINIDYALALNIALALIFGKSIGIALFSILAVKLRVAQLPNGVTFQRIIGAGFLAGVGFTMSIFIANLAFAGNTLLINSSKIGILAGSFIAGFIGFVIIRSSLKKS